MHRPHMKQSVLSNRANPLQAESARGFTWLGHSNLAGKPDGVQVMVNKGHAFVGHPFTGGGITVVDVRDPRDPTPVNFLHVHPRSWTLDRKSTRLNSSHLRTSRMPSSA